MPFTQEDPVGQGKHVVIVVANSMAVEYVPDGHGSQTGAGLDGTMDDT